MTNEFIAIAAVVAILAGTYILRANDLIEKRTSAIVYGCTCIAIGAVFVAVCVAIFIQSGETVEFRKHGPGVVAPEDSGFKHLVSWIFIGFFAWIFFRAGWQLLTKGDLDD